MSCRTQINEKKSGSTRGILLLALPDFLPHDMIKSGLELAA
jgi:hypothetical protein